MKIGLILFLFSTSLFSKGSKLPPEKPEGSKGFINESYSACAKNVEEQIENISKKPKKFYKFKVNSKVFYSQNYRMSIFNKNKLGIDNHFQGIVKLKGKNNFIISAGDFKRKEAHLFVVNEGRVIKKMIIGKGDLWHPGGLGIAGDVMVVPNQPYKTKGPDMLQIFDVSDPKNPKSLLDIEMPVSAAISLHRRESDRNYILNSGHGLYFSKSDDILEGFRPIRKFSKRINTGQSQEIIEDCDTKELFLLTFDNTAKAAPIEHGKNFMALYKIEFKESRPSFTKIKVYELKCAFMKCNFDAGVGVYIENGKIKIRAIHHFRQQLGKTIRSGEYY